MSVINQMLKDLEERTPDNNQRSATAVTIPAKSSPVKVVLITLTILLMLNGIGWYVWQLNQENKLLKEQHISIINKDAKRIVEGKISAKAAVPPRPEQAATKKISSPVENNRANTVFTANNPPVVNNSTRESIAVPALKIEVTKQDSSDKNSNNQSGVKTKLGNNAVATKSSSQAVEIKLSKVRPESTQVVKTEPLIKVPASMSVSRRKLTADEIVEQKLDKAERFLAENSVAKAEQLFQDILIIEPNHKQARKKLAALWFGRKAYQEAINILSQGIALAPLDSELRTMKAQIYIKQGNTTLAFNTLISLAELEQVDYQILLANVAQEISKYKAAIKAYQLLIKMQPDNGRWHLGLAIVFDKNSQFGLAVQEYMLAVSKAGLSNSSAEFAQQRIQALVE